MNFDKEREIAEILSRKVAGELSAQEQAVLDAWEARSSSNRELAERFLSAEEQKEYREFVSGIDVSSAVGKIGQKHRRRNRRRLAWSLSSAAVVAAAVLGTVFLAGRKDVLQDDTLAQEAHHNAILRIGDARPVYLSGTGNETAWQELADAEAPEEAAPVTSMVKVEIPRGSEYKLRLDDGTVVWLNSESSIEYPGKFADEARVVTLSGEGYFEVAPESRAFIVATEIGAVTVHGTSFNVSSYKGNAMVTTLVSGSVTFATQGSSVRMTPGQQATVNESGGVIGVTEVNTDYYIAWTKGLFEFERMPLADICTRLARWYDVEFVFEGGTDEKRFTGGTWKYVPLEEFLSRIERLTDVTFVRDGSVVTVKPWK